MAKLPKVVQPFYEQEDTPGEDWELDFEGVSDDTCDHCWKPALVRLAVDPTGQHLEKTKWCKACWETRKQEM